MNSVSDPAVWSLRVAGESDVPALEALIHISARSLLAVYYSPSQIAAAMGPVFGVDRQLIRDGTYFVAETGGAIVGCGGWSRRHSLYGGDAGREDDDDFLDPRSDAARVRAFFVHPEWARRGIGHAIMDACEKAIAQAGFREVNIVATLGGEPLYVSHGYTVIERFEIPLPDGQGLAAVRMTKSMNHEDEAARTSARRSENCRKSYDIVADEYVRRIFDELQHKPLDRQLLDRFAASLRGAGAVCDVGCGPGHVTRHLHERGVEVSGVDLSEAMVERARRLNPGIEFQQADMMALSVPDGAWAGITAFYSIIHIPREEMECVFMELRRALRPGGMLLLAFHIGDDCIHLEDWWDHKVSVDFFFFRSVEIAGHLRAAGFDVSEMIERDPYPDIEHQSRRAYIFARRPE